MRLQKKKKNLEEGQQNVTCMLMQTLPQMHAHTDKQADAHIDQRMRTSYVDRHIHAAEGEGTSR